MVATPAGAVVEVPAGAVVATPAGAVVFAIAGAAVVAAIAGAAVVAAIAGAVVPVIAGAVVAAIAGAVVAAATGAVVAGAVVAVLSPHATRTTESIMITANTSRDRPVLNRDILLSPLTCRKPDTDRSVCCDVCRADTERGFWRRCQALMCLYCFTFRPLSPEIVTSIIHAL